MEAGSNHRPRGGRPDVESTARRRVVCEGVLQNLTRLESPSWRSHPLQIGADTALLAGCLDTIPDLDRERAELVRAAILMMGEDYVAGFRDGFDLTPPTRRKTLRYVEGLDDGNMVGYAVRHSLEGRTHS